MERGAAKQASLESIQQEVHGGQVYCCRRRKGLRTIP